VTYEVIIIRAFKSFKTGGPKFLLKIEIVFDFPKVTWNGHQYDRKKELGIIIGGITRKT